MPLTPVFTGPPGLVAKRLIQGTLLSRPCRIHFALHLLGFPSFCGCLELPGIDRRVIETLQFEYGHEAKIATRIEPAATVPGTF